jgi:hypothetical protein
VVFGARDQVLGTGTNFRQSVEIRKQGKRKEVNKKSWVEEVKEQQKRKKGGFHEEVF